MLAAALESGPDGHRVGVARLGGGAPLVLLHGYPDNLQIWSALAPLLAGARTVIALDWPGMGRSEAWPGGATPFHMADRLGALLDAWRLERVSLLAHDMGGQPALAFAIRYPGRVEKLVVMNSLVMPDVSTSWEIRLLRRYGWNRVLLRHLARPVFGRAVRTSLPRGVRLSPELRADLWECFRRPEVRAFVAKMCAGYQGTLPRLADEYASLNVPTLLLWGERDRHFPPDQARRLCERAQKARFEIVAGGEHWMAWHAPEAVAARVLGFLG